MPYLSIAVLSIPIPNASPLYLSESIPQFSRTFLLTIPAPRISIQPVPLQSLHPLPPHSKQLQSTSTDGSVNGKYEGRSLVVVPSPYTFLTKTSSMPFKSQSVIFSSTTSPSICENIGECVASSSERNTLPGDRILIGGFLLSIT